MPRRPTAPLVANPVLIGAVTTIVVIVAVFLAYNANNGLPFVPTYTLKARVPDAANLVRGNQVRIGGARVGVVSDIVAVPGPDHTTQAQLTLKLQTSVRPLPVDSTVVIRPRSALGLKYVEITRGHRSSGFSDGATMQLSRARPEPVELDQFFDVFNARTRAAIQVNLTELGDALAGRGDALNEAIAGLPVLLVNLRSVTANLASPATNLRRLFPSLEAAAAALASVAETQASLFVNLDSTFSALAAVRDPIERSIAGAPPALRTAVAELPRQRPFYANTARLFRRLRPGFTALDQAAPDLASTVGFGAPALRRTSALNDRLTGALRALEGFAEDPEVRAGVRGLVQTAAILNPIFAFLTPAQTTCNYLALFFRNAASMFSEGDRNGARLRFNLVVLQQGPNSEAGPAAAAANGPASSDPLRANNFLHVNPYPNTASPGQIRECEAGNESYLRNRAVIGHEPGNQGTLHDGRHG